MVLEGGVDAAWTDWDKDIELFNSCVRKFNDRECVEYLQYSEQIYSCECCMGRWWVLRLWGITIHFDITCHMSQHGQFHGRHALPVMHKAFSQ